MKVSVKILITLMVLSAFTAVSAEKTVRQKGIASYYADKFEGRRTANGELYDHSKLTAAHLSLPFGTKVRVTNLSNNKSITVRINDRGPFVEGRVIDLSLSAAKAIGMLQSGTADVILETVTADDSDETTGFIEPAEEQTGAPDPVYFKITAEKIKPQGFGVQIGSYIDLANLARVTRELKNEEQFYVVQPLEINETTVYRLIAGRFKSKVEADRLKEKFSKDFPDAFTVEYGEFYLQ